MLDAKFSIEHDLAFRFIRSACDSLGTWPPARALSLSLTATTLVHLVAGNVGSYDIYLSSASGERFGDDGAIWILPLSPDSGERGMRRPVIPIWPPPPPAIHAGGH